MRNLQDMNPNAKLQIVQKSALENLKEYELLAIIGEQPKATIIEFNRLCRAQNCMFYYCFTRGFYGFMFSDLQSFTFYTDKGEFKLDYKMYQDIFNEKEIPLKQQKNYAATVGFLKYLNPDFGIEFLAEEYQQEAKGVETQVSMQKLEVPAVYAILGGVCAQDIIRALTHKEKPIHNLFVYDGIRGDGFVHFF